jgi:hypothetical protein
MPDTSLLADPTDYGNRPGDGPLRPGGKSVSEVTPSSAKDLPSTRNKASERQQNALRLVRDLWEGPERIRARSTEHLPKNPGEDSGNYSIRLKMAVLHNFFRRTVEGMVGLIFRQDPVLGDDVPARIVRDWENIDNAGTHGDVFCRELETDAMTAGHAAILVDFPKTDGRQDARSEMIDIRPYWVHVLKDNILSWRPVQEAGVTKLQQVVLLEKTMVPDGLFGEREQTRYRVMFLDESQKHPARYKVLEITKDKQVIEIEEGWYGNQVELPLSEISTSGRRGLLDSDPPLADVAYLTVAHYQQWSDYVTALHHTVPFIATYGYDAVNQDGTPINELAIGPGAWLDIKNPEGKAEYVAHGGQSIDDQRQALADIKSDIGSLGLAMLQPQKRAAETAEAKRLDKATSDSALSVSARALQDGVERALGFHARYLGEQSGGSVKINRDFEGLLMDAPVMMAYAALIKAGFPIPVALAMLQQGGRIPQDANLEELEMQMLAAGIATDFEGEAEPEPLEGAA